VNTPFINIKSLPTANAGVNPSICSGGTTTLSGSGGSTYNWLPGGATTANISVNPTTTTIYTLTVNLNNGCKDID